MKLFLKSIIPSFIGSTLSCGFIVFIFFFLIPLLVISFFVSETKTFFREQPELKTINEPSYLVLNLSNGLSEFPTDSLENRYNFFNVDKNPIGFYDTIDVLDNFAKDDPMIKGILILGSLPESALAKVAELKNTLERLNKLKPVIFYLENPTFQDYYLATAGSKICMNPFSTLQIKGFSSTGLYFKSMLDKLGIGIQISKVGVYKSAVEPLIADKMSPAHRKQTQESLNSIWNNISKKIRTDRKIKAETRLDDIANAEAFLWAEDAKKEGLIDLVLYKDQLLDSLKDDKKSKTFSQIALRDYISLKKTEKSDFKDKIAIAYLNGEIVDGESERGSVGGESFSKMLRDIRNSKDIKGFILRVNSPGGSVYASEQIRREVELISKKMPVIVSMGDVAASGGYWVSTPAERIFADKNTITGSIGVFGVLPNFKGLGEKIGVSTESVSTHILSEIDTVRRPKTDAEMKLFQAQTDKIYDLFLSYVAKGRMMEKEAVAKIAEGRVWTGEEAVKLKLIDQLGGIQDAIDYLSKKIGSDTKSISIIQYPKDFDANEFILSLFSEEKEADLIAKIKANEINEMGIIGKTFLKYRARLKALNDPHSIYARLPWDIDSEK